MEEEKVAVVDEEDELKAPKYIRVWGPFDKVHPASGGVKSQRQLFTATTFNPSQHHPAMYAVHDTSQYHASLPYQPFHY